MEKELYNSIECPIWIKNRNNQITFINKTFQEIFNITDIKTGDQLNLFSQLVKLKSPQIIRLNEKEYVNKMISKQDEVENIVNILVDLGERKEKNEFDHDRSILKTVIDNIPELIFYKDNQLRYIVMNKACETFYTSRGVHEVIGRNDLELPLEREFIESCYNHDKQVLEERKTLYIEEDAPIAGSNERSYYQTIKTPIINDQGEVDGLVGIVLDITQHKSIEKKLRDIIYLDKLTGLYNRAYFYEKIQELVSNKQFPIGIITGDVNSLKILNDTIGHIQGGELLKSIAAVYKKVSRDQYFVFRWGGDEFITIIPNATKEKCETFMEEVRKNCHQSENEFFQLSVAQGASLLNEHDNIDNILQESEDKVYREKILQNKSVRTSIMSTLNKTLQVKNIETEEHTNRVANYCQKIGQALDLENDILDQLVLVAKLHDIGKIGIPDEILLKPSKLTPEEYEIMKTHSEKGHRFALLLPELSHIARGILTHHERWDGKGYPLGISGHEIPLTARIVSIVDAFDAMTNDRVYGKTKSREEALEEIIQCSGTQFDPDIVAIFSQIINEELKE